MEEQPRSSSGQPGGLTPVRETILQAVPGSIPTKNTGGKPHPVVEPSYKCQLCHDAGVRHPRRQDGTVDYSTVAPCECYAQDLAANKTYWLLQQCELPPGSEHMTFDNFDVSPVRKEVFEECRALAEGGDNSSWLTLQSKTDHGKTHLLVAIARRRLAAGRPAKYAYVPLLMDELRRGFGQEGDRSYESRFQMFCSIPLLLLDDLGVQHQTSWVQERLDTMIDYRLMHNLGLVVTTNCMMDELPFRIASRLQRHGKVVWIEGPPYHRPGVSRKTRDRE